MHTAQIDAQLHDGGSLRATFRMADEQEARDAAEEFIRANEPLIEVAATTVTTNINGRFDNAMFEDVADMIYDRHAGEDDAWTREQIDNAIRAEEDTFFHSYIAPMVDEIEDYLADVIR